MKDRPNWGATFNQNYSLDGELRSNCKKRPDKHGNGLRRINQVKEEMNNVYSQEEAIRASYAYGHIEAWLEVFTRSHGLSYPTIAGRVGELLQAQTSREILGTNHRVPSVQATPTRRYRTKRIKALEMAEYALSGEPSVKKVSLSKYAIKQRQYYRDPNKGQYSRACVAILSKQRSPISGHALVNMVKLKNPDWSSHQIWGALNVAVKHKKVLKGPDGLLRASSKL